MVEILPGIHEHPLAAELTEQGLRAAGRQEFDEAAFKLDRAAQLVTPQGRLPGQRPSPRPRSQFTGTEVQYATITVWRARVAMTAALQTSASEMTPDDRQAAVATAEWGMSLADQAREVLEPFMSGRQVVYTAASKRELAAAGQALAAKGWAGTHTAGREARDRTFDTMARATATHTSLGFTALALAGSLTATERPDEHGQVMAGYGMAYAQAQTGETSGQIALLAMRAERAAGRFMHAGQWAGRLAAAYGKIVGRESNLTNPRHGLRQLGTLSGQFAGRGPEGLSRARAVAALMHPLHFDLVTYPTPPEVPGESYDSD